MNQNHFKPNRGKQKKGFGLCRLLLFACLAMTGCFEKKEPVENLDDPKQAIETGKTALQKGYGYNWYDKTKDAAAALHVDPPPQYSRNRFWGWLNALINVSTIGELLELLAYVCFAVAIAALIYVLVKSKLTQNDDTSTNIKKKKARIAPTLEQVEALPLAGRNPNADFLAEAKRHYQAGDFTDAIVYLFSHRLLQLDQHHLVRLAKGKTNRQYLREVKTYNKQYKTDRTAVAQLLEATTQLFEEAFFGKHPPSRDQFESCWAQNARFQTLMSESIATTEGAK